MRPVLRLLAAGAITCAAVLGARQAVSAAPLLTIETVSWNVIGLDSNDTAVGPNSYPVGVRVCNEGTTAATNLVLDFVWDSENAYVELDEAATTTLAGLAAGACADVFWNVVIQRTAAAYNTARSYHITVTDDSGATASTPVPRELYVQSILSQNRNQVLAISGPAALTVGDEVTFTLDASTAPNGYEQVEAFLTLPSSMFELLSVSTTYDGPPRATTDLLYADACGWDDDPASLTYLSCIGPETIAGGKAGGPLLVEYRVRAVGAGTAVLSALIYDKSGASYHYNSDFGVGPNLFVVTISAPPVVPAPDPLVPAPDPLVPSPDPLVPGVATPGLTPASAPDPAPVPGPLPAGPVAVPELPRTGVPTSLVVTGVLLVVAGLIVLLAVKAGPPRTTIRMD